jgi:hypothetical protein
VPNIYHRCANTSLSPGKLKRLKDCCQTVGCFILMTSKRTLLTVASFFFLSQRRCVCLRRRNVCTTNTINLCTLHTRPSKLQLKNTPSFADSVPTPFICMWGWEAASANLNPNPNLDPSRKNLYNHANVIIASARNAMHVSSVY